MMLHSPITDNEIDLYFTVSGIIHQSEMLLFILFRQLMKTFWTQEIFNNDKWQVTSNDMVSAEESKNEQILSKIWNPANDRKTGNNNAFFFFIFQLIIETFINTNRTSSPSKITVSVQPATFTVSLRWKNTSRTRKVLYDGKPAAA